MTLLSKPELKTVLNNISNIRLTVIGDACLDIYWWADMQKSELSRETPHHNLPVVKEALSPGAAGNVAVNAKAIGCSSVRLVSLIGEDWRSQAFIKELQNRQILTDSLIASSDYLTPTYIKPLRSGYGGVVFEDPRIDFAPFTEASDLLQDQLIKAIGEAAQASDVICVSDQLAYGCITSRVREKICSLSASGVPVFVDSRDRVELFHDVIVKPNALEGWHAIKHTHGVSFPEKPTINDYREIAKHLSDKNNAPVCLTLGPDGCLWSDTGADSRSQVYVPAFKEDTEIDIVGAGDAFIASASAALAAKASVHQALQFASLVSNIIIHKLQTTGSASPEEIMNRYDQLSKEKQPYKRVLTDCDI